MKVWIGIVSHRHGTNTYAGKTRAALMRQLYEYVEENWADEIRDDVFPSGQTRRFVIDRYFEEVTHEQLDMFDVEVME